MRPEAAPPEVRWPKAAAPLRASRRAWLAPERRQTCMLRKVEEAPEAPARPEAASSAVLRPKHRREPADMRDVERAARESRMRIRCAAGAEGVRRA